MKNTINIGKEFSPDPAGRFREDGNSSGEAFREDLLKAAVLGLGSGEKLTIIIDDNVEGYGSSFLSEGFAGMVKYGYITSNALLSKIDIVFTNTDFEFYKNKIYQYIKEANYNSEEYNPNRR